MKFLSYSMSNKVAYDSKAVRFNIFLHGGTNITDRISRSSFCNALKERFSGHIHELLRFRGYLTYRKGPSSVSMPTIFYHAKIKANNIALFEGFVSWNSVYDDVVDRNTCRSRESSVAEEAGDSSFISNEPVGESIQITGSRFSRYDGFGAESKSSGDDAS